jgi:hypothetical protein
MKKATFILQNGGGSYKLIIENSDNPLWLKVNNEIVFDYQVEAIKKDLKNDGFKVEVKKY